MAEIVTRLPMGADVPEWLLTVEPRPDVPPGHSRRGVFRFAVDVEIIDLPDQFIVLPKIAGAFGAVIDCTGMVGCLQFASSKPVNIVHAWAVVESRESAVQNWMPDEAVPWLSNTPLALTPSTPGEPGWVPLLAPQQQRSNAPDAMLPPGAHRPPWWKRAWRAVFS